MNTIVYSGQVSAASKKLQISLSDSVEVLHPRAFRALTIVFICPHSLVMRTYMPALPRMRLHEYPGNHLPCRRFSLPQVQFLLSLILDEIFAFLVQKRVASRLDTCAEQPKLVCRRKGKL